MGRKKVDRILKELIGFRPGEKVRVKTENGEAEGTVVACERDYVFVRAGAIKVKGTPFQVSALRWYSIDDVEPAEG